MAYQDLLKLPSHFTLEASLQEQLSHRAGHQRCLVGGHELLLILHEVPQPGVPERGALFFWKRNDGRWTQPGGPGINEVSELLGRYEATIASLQEALEKIITARQIFPILRHASPLQRAIHHLAQALEQALAFEPDDRDIRSLRDRAKDIERAADLLVADARIISEFKTAEHQEAQTHAADRLVKNVNQLNLLAGFFLPLIALAGILGINRDLPSFVKWLCLAIVIGWLLAMRIGGIGKLIADVRSRLGR